MIEEARDFVIEKAIKPVLEDPMASDALIKNTRHSLSWLNRFDRVGDLIAYMDRFRGEGSGEIYGELQRRNLPTYESIHGDFMKRFGSWASERTRLDDFIVGKSYTGSQLVIFAEIYDTRSGGILRIGRGEKLQAIFLKATFSGGKYANAWLDEPTRLKYF